MQGNNRHTKQSFKVKVKMPGDLKVARHLSRNVDHKALVIKPVRRYVEVVFSVL
jgi:hypothetical protein